MSSNTELIEQVQMLARNISAQFSIAVAESCTGGLLGAALSSQPGSSSFFMGGVIAYSNKLKVKILGVDPKTLASFGAVSQQAAEEMATGVRRITGVTHTISVTGIAGPHGGTPDKPVGTVYIGIADQMGVRVQRCQFDGDRDSVRQQTAIFALKWLNSILN
ncbi:MAG: CinA family protein [Proteobacteria bacterium]|nr:CinA family protein [Pseudomonadota bacterium]